MPSSFSSSAVGLCVSLSFFACSGSSSGGPSHELGQDLIDAGHESPDPSPGDAGSEVSESPTPQDECAKKGPSFEWDATTQTCVSKPPPPDPAAAIDGDWGYIGGGCTDTEARSDTQARGTRFVLSIHHGKGTFSGTLRGQDQTLWCGASAAAVFVPPQPIDDTGKLSFDPATFDDRVPESPTLCSTFHTLFGAQELQIEDFEGFQSDGKSLRLGKPTSTCASYRLLFDATTP